MKKRLVPGAVPTVFAKPSAPRVGNSGEGGCKPVAAASCSRKRPATTMSATATKKTRSAAEKRQRTRVRYTALYKELLYNNATFM